MAKRASSIVLVCTFSLAVLQLTPCSASMGAVNDGYAEVVWELNRWFSSEASDRDPTPVVRSIHAWLRANPQPQYTEPTSEQMLQWKVELARAFQNTELDFSANVRIHSSLLSEIEDSQFSFLGRTYNRESLNFWLLEDCLGYYSGYGRYCYYEDSSIYDYSPVEHFVREYTYFQNNIRSWENALAWLRAFCSVGANCSLNGAGSIVTRCSDDLLTILKLYLFMGRHVLEANPEIYDRSKAPYSESGLTFWFGSGMEEILSDGLYLIEALENRLTDPDKADLIGFVYPDYMDIDNAVLIYALITEQ